VNWLQGFSLLPAIAVAATAGLLVILDDRRLAIGVLAVQYIMTAWLVSLSLPFGVAAAEAASGLLACVVLWLTASSQGWLLPEARVGGLPTGHAFRWIAVLLVAMVAFGIGREGWRAIPGLADNAALGVAFLLSLGLLQLGITDDALRVGAGILTTLSGFEVAYAAVEPALAVVALLSSVHLGVALVVSYLLVGRAGEDAAEDISR
jgi:hypothetical protein